MSTWTIRTTLNPSQEITVKEEEYRQLLGQGLIDGQPVPGPPDPDDLEVAALFDDETSETYQRLLTQLAAAVSGSNPFGDAQRAASVAAVEDADTVAPTGAWDFDLAPTVNGSPLGGGGTDAEAVRDLVGTVLTAGAGVTKAVDDAGDTVTIAAPDVARLMAAAGATGTFNGAWAGNAAMTAGELRTAEGGLFRCTVNHTSNNAGFRYDREKWEQVPVPALAGPSTVRIRQLDLTNVGTGVSTPPAAGVFQSRPKQFNYSQERVLLTFAAPGDITTSGTGATTVAGTAPGGSIIGTSPNGSNNWTGTKTFTAKDLTGMHLRIPIKATGAGTRYLVFNLTSSGTDYTNSVQTQLLSSEIPSGLWQVFSVPLTDMTTAGTGVNIAAINGLKIEMTGPGTIEFGRITYHPNVSAKAKCVLWFDDGFSNHLAAVKTAASYGFPVTLASIAQNLLDTASIGADNARYIQDVLRGQIAVHAFGPNDHNAASMTDAQLFEEMLAYQHFGLAMGFHGVEDLAYFNPGLNGPSSAERQAIVKRLFRSARGTGARYVETLPPGDATFTRALQQGAGNTSAGTFQPFAQKAINCKGLAQFVWHSMDATALTEFATFCAWLDGQRASIDVVTPAQAYDPLCV